MPRGTHEKCLAQFIKEKWSDTQCIHRVFASQVVRKLKEYLHDQSHHCCELVYPNFCVSYGQCHAIITSRLMCYISISGLRWFLHVDSIDIFAENLYRHSFQAQELVLQFSWIWEDWLVTYITYCHTIMFTWLI